MTETISRPIYLLSEKDSAPELLKNALVSIGIASNEALQSISEDIFVEFDTKFKPISDTSHIKLVSSHSHLIPMDRAVLVIDINGRGMLIPAASSLYLKDDHSITEIQLDDISSLGELEKRLVGKEILVDKQGIYISFRSIFIKFMMVYGNEKRVTFKNGPYEWNGFQSLFDDAIKWIRLLDEVIRKYSLKYRIPLEEAEKKLAEYLSSLNLTARNPDYIRGWWSNYEVVTTDYGTYPLYKVEHPRGLDDLKKIYEGINSIIPEKMLEQTDAERSYIASLVIQKFRRSLLKGKIKGINPALRQLYIQLEREIKNIVDNSPVFKVKLAYDVEIVEEVEPFRVMDEYKDYIRISKNEEKKH